MSTRTKDMSGSNSMRLRPAAAHLLLLAFLAALPATAQGTLSCRRLDVVADTRSDGTAELIGDLVLSCTGGRPVAAGAALPRYQFLVGIRGTFATRMMPAANNKFSTATDALLLVGEPSAAAQEACPYEARACKALAGAAPNVFAGKQLGQSMLAFADIPVNPPGDNGEMVIRVTNLRVHAAAMRGAQGGIVTNVQMFDDSGRAVAIQNAERQAARVLDSHAVTIVSATGVEVNSATAVPLLVTPAQLPKKDPAVQQSFQIRFRELFASAFKRRNIATTGFDPALVAGQSRPGADYLTESGFYNPLFPQALYLSQLGLADSGTRLRVVFEGIPENVLVWVSVRDTEAGTTDYSLANARALLTYTNPLGGGNFSYSYPWSGDFAQLFVERGTATASWEVVTANPAKLEQLSFTIAITAQGTAKLGTATLRAYLAPGDGTTGSEPSAIPRFEDRSTRRTAFRVSNSLELPPVHHLSAASFELGVAAPASIMAAFGSGLAATTTVSNEPRDTLDGMTIDFIDAIGLRHSGLLLVVSPNQVNYVVPESLPVGPAVVNLRRAGAVVATGSVNIEKVAPGLFSANGDGKGVAAGTLLRLGSSASEPETIGLYDAGGSRWSPRPIDLQAGDVYLSMYGTGIRGRTSLGNVKVTIAGVAVPVLFAAGHGSIAGLDQLNVGPLPKELAGKGEVTLELLVEGQRANPVLLKFQ
jgi:uncharacterized protein (TIGR03437 family)